MSKPEVCAIADEVKILKARIADKLNRLSEEKTEILITQIECLLDSLSSEAQAPACPPGEDQPCGKSH